MDGGSSKRLKPVPAASSGTRVELASAPMPTVLNGQEGTVIWWHDAEGRLQAQMGDDTDRMFKRVRCPPTHLSVSPLPSIP
eukprot:NODE_18698_length_881_cov_2.583554.p1 GENE.NODE_18698_length_881_cov_2.583554~~NODE_18698_length_881_cov_2.583554.p1  ORF type:complete len:81 (+),score=11.17 NODE_18698_length_881_cov_2.583554:576-818(+)